MSKEQIDELIEYNLEYFNETLTDEQIANSMLDKVELETKLQEKNKEIERLNNIINTFEEWLEIKVNKANKSITFINNGIAYSQFGIADEILDLITNLQEENEELKDKLDIFMLSNKTKQETIDKFRKRIDKAIEYIENLQQSNEELQRDYNKTIDFGIYETDNLLSILKGDTNE